MKKRSGWKLTAWGFLLDAVTHQNLKYKGNRKKMKEDRITIIALWLDKVNILQKTYILMVTLFMADDRIH